MTDDELKTAWAIIDLSLQQLDYHDDAVQLIIGMMNCNEKAAETFFHRLENIQIDPDEFKHLSNEELVTEIVRLNKQIENYREAFASKASC